MEVIISIHELQSMIKAVKTDNLIHRKKERIPNKACGIFKFEDGKLIEHRHIGMKIFETIEY